MSKSPIKIDDVTYPTAENAFQAMKCKKAKDRVAFVQMTPVEAKRAGKRVDLRSNWNKDRNKVMYHILWHKFTQNEELKKKLIATGKEKISHVNHWRDTYWGVYNGKGKDVLGRMLMNIREKLQETEEIIDIVKSLGDDNDGS